MQYDEMTEALDQRLDQGIEHAGVVLAATVQVLSLLFNLEALLSSS